MTFDRDLTVDPARYVRHLKLGDHAVLFYDTEDVKRRVSFPFLEAGLLNGRAVAYAIPEHKLDSERREIERYGVNVDRFPKEAFTIMSAEEWYLKKGKAQAKTILANCLELAREKEKAGFTGVCVAGEMKVFFDYAKSKELLRYETLLDRQLDPSMCALCLYDTHRLDREQFVELNKSHGHSIFKCIGFKSK